MATYVERPHGNHGRIGHLLGHWAGALTSRFSRDHGDRGAGRAFKAMDQEKAEAMKKGRPIL